MFYFYKESTVLELLLSALISLPSSLTNSYLHIILYNLTKMLHLLFVTPLILALQATSMFILVPLYVYPGTSASAWSNVTSAVQAYPQVQWQVIINPGNGPGVTGCPTDTDYISSISILNGYANVKTLGYVDTSWTNRAYSAVIQDIDTYASWWNCDIPGYNVSIDGIFFDDVNTTASSAIFTYMQNASAYAYSQVPSYVTPVIFNPGTIAPPQLFSYCDTMIEFEDLYSLYKNATTIKAVPSSYRAQSALLVTNTPETTAPIASLVHTMAYYKIGAVYFTTDENPSAYRIFDLDLLEQIAAAVAAG